MYGTGLQHARPVANSAPKVNLRVTEMPMVGHAKPRWSGMHYLECLLCSSRASRGCESADDPSINAQKVREEILLARYSTKNHSRYCHFFMICVFAHKAVRVPVAC
jgi:hypothetical protein